MDVPEEGTSSPTETGSPGQGPEKVEEGLPDVSSQSGAMEGTNDANNNSNDGDGDEDIDTDDDKPTAPRSPIIPEERRLQAIRASQANVARGEAVGTMDPSNLRPPELEIPKPGNSFVSGLSNQQDGEDEGDSDVYGSDVEQRQQNSQQQMAQTEKNYSEDNKDDAKSEKSIPEETRRKQVPADDLMADTADYFSVSSHDREVESESMNQQQQLQQGSPEERTESPFVVIPGPTAEFFTHKFMNPSPSPSPVKGKMSLPLSGDRGDFSSPPLSTSKKSEEQSPAKEIDTDDDENDDTDQIMDMISHDRQRTDRGGNNLDDSQRSEQSDDFVMEELTRSQSKFYLRTGRFKSESDLARAIKTSSVVRPTLPQRSASTMPNSDGATIPTSASLLSGAPRQMLSPTTRTPRMATMTGDVLVSSPVDSAPPFSSSSDHGTGTGTNTPTASKEVSNTLTAPTMQAHNLSATGAPTSTPSSEMVYRSSTGNKKQSNDIETDDADANADIEAAIATATYTAKAMSVHSSSTGSRRSYGRRSRGSYSSSSGSGGSGRGSSRWRGSASGGTRGSASGGTRSYGGRMVIVGRNDDGSSRRSRITPEDDYEDQEKNLEIFEALTQDVMAKSFGTLRVSQQTALTRLKFVLLAIFILCTIIGCTCVLIVTRNFDSNASNDIYQDLIEQVMDKLSTRWITTMTSLDSYIVAMVSVGQLSYANPKSGVISTTWPFVTLPDYAVQATKLQSLNPAIVHLGQYHVVRDDQRESWETYTTTSRGWLWQSVDVQEHFQNEKAVIDAGAGTSAPLDTIYTEDRIHNHEGPVPPGPEFFLPLWQSSPLPASSDSPVYNQDGRTSLGVSSSLEAALPELMNNRVVVGPVRNLPPEELEDEVDGEDNERNRRLQQQVDANATNSFLQHILGPDNPTLAEPVSDIYYPIRTGAADFVYSPYSVTDTRIAVMDTSSKGVLVGIGSFTIQWRQLLKDLVPNDIPGLFVVVRNTCGQEFTYLVKPGSEAAVPATGNGTVEDDGSGPGLSLEFLGTGDHHDTSYDALEEIIYLPSILEQLRRDDYLPLYTGIPLTETSCPYSIHLYPSDRLFDDLATDSPRVLMLATALIFIFCGSLFLLYDILIRVSNKALWSKDNLLLYIRDSLSDARPNTTKALKDLNDTWRSKLVRSTKKLPAESTQDEREAAEAAAEAEAIAELNSVHDVLAASIKGEKVDPPSKLGTPPVGTIQLTGRLSHLDPTKIISNKAQVGRTATMADLFPDTTVMFCHLSGFIAWSAKLTPQEVFMLLDKLYTRLDEMANQRKILKVDTIGDVYAAVAGLPQPLPEHGLIMARYAADCINALKSIKVELAPTLGSGTKDLCLRIGLHSGPVMAGLLSGEGVHFQIVGETVDMAERMERTGARNKIHCSQSTATWIRADGMSHWVTPREDQVTVRGKGTILSYWVQPKDAATSSSGSVADNRASTMDKEDASAAKPDIVSEASGSVSKDEASNSSRQPQEGRASITSTTSTTPSTAPSTAKSMLTKVMKQRDLAPESSNNPQNKTSRLVDWNVDILSRLLRNLVAKRNAMDENASLTEADMNPNARKYLPGNGAPSSVLKEVVEVIEMPEMEARAYFKCANADLDATQLDQVVEMQLRAFVTTIETMYRRHPYHNFEHASHVGMSLAILLSRVASPEQPVLPLNESDEKKKKKKKKGDSNDDFMKALSHHNRTFGISSDPLVQFAVMFATLVHDLDHPGVPNRQLIREGSPMAQKFESRSLSQQNAIHRAWDLLAQDNFRELRDTICPTKRDLKRFREIFVTAVMATDLADVESNRRRALRWQKAFSPEAVEARTKKSQSSMTFYSKDELDKLATIVIEVLMQASVVAHAMQHWHVYLKWSERALMERKRAYKQARSDQDPFMCWHQLEMKFFDRVVLPLAQKLCDCGVFGDFGAEYLKYSKMNREEWERRGQSDVINMVARIKGLPLPAEETQSMVSGSTINC